MWISPPWARTACRAIERPRPRPDRSVQRMNSSTVIGSLLDSDLGDGQAAPPKYRVPMSGITTAPGESKLPPVMSHDWIDGRRAHDLRPVI
jgi:hypothetical protein